MADAVPQESKENLDAEFVRMSSEVRRLERNALPKVNRLLPNMPLFGEFDVENISVVSYEAALESAKRIESSGVKGKKVERVEERILTEEEIERIPAEKIEVVARTEKEILAEEEKLDEMKTKFAKLISEMPKEKPKERMVLEEAAVKAEEKPAAPEVDQAKVEEIKQLNEDFKSISMKREEREKAQRIRKMKKEIEDILEGG
ncbi:MAG: hypothetical protein NT130_03075 [Candidatus Micrarchaeota archaeon]|nr:hypothetical protein [Candidatus Micrarchaeota archaeon]